MSMKKCFRAKKKKEKKMFQSTEIKGKMTLRAGIHRGSPCELQCKLLLFLH